MGCIENAEELLAGSCHIAATPVELLCMESTDRFVVMRLNGSGTGSAPRVVWRADADRAPVAAAFERQQILNQTDFCTKQVSADRPPALGRTVVVLGNRYSDRCCNVLKGLCV